MKFVARHGGEDIPIEVQRLADGYRVRIGDRWMNVDLVDAGRFLRSVRLEDGTQLSLIHHRTGTTHEISLGDSTIHVAIVDPLSIKGRHGTEDMGAAGTVKALMPGRITSVMVKKGERVHKGAALLVLEAMKMQNEIQAPAEGIVDEVFVEAGQTVESGADLVRIAPSVA